MSRTTSFPGNPERGMIGFAVLLLAGVVIMVFTMSFFVSWADYQSSLAFDSYHSQLVEMAGLQQVVQESILALRSTEPAYNPISVNNSIDTEINTRLSAMSFTPGVSVAMTAFSTPPAHVFYPFCLPGQAPVASDLRSLLSSLKPPGIAGTGNHTLRFLTSGPTADLGTASYTFARTVSNSPAENRTITTTARLFSVPVTNIDCIAYGLPITGSVPSAAPWMPNGFFVNSSSANVISRLVTTLNDPSKDATFYSDLFDPNNASSLGYQWQNSVLFSWDAYEFIWGNIYQNELLNTANAAGTLFDFDAPVNPTITGVTSFGDPAISVTIDLSLVPAITGPLVIVDSLGKNASGNPRNIQILGSPEGNSLNASPLLLYLKNTGSGPTNVSLSGDNNRPIILLSRQCVLTFFGNPQFQGAIILDPNSKASGSATLFGHLSFYYAANPLPAWDLILSDLPSVKAALAPLAPRVLLVSVSATNEN
jgi:hypothetical protein